MVIKIQTSIEDSNCYNFNLGYLRRALEKDEVRGEGKPDKLEKEFVFNDEARIYDFTRTAQATVREDIVSFLSHIDVLPGLQEEGREDIKQIFGCFFKYQKYKNHLQQNGDRRVESMSMLIFNDGNGEKDQPRYVAHVSFESISRRTDDKQFKVDVTLSCQRFTYFEAQNEDFDAIQKALKDLHLHKIKSMKDDGRIQK